MPTSAQDPKVVNVKGTAAADFDLTVASPAVNVGATLSNLTLDFLNRPAPVGPAPDIGAFEYQGTTQ